MSKTKEKPIIGFFDVACPKCQKRYGWHGKITDEPPCPKCGHRITPEEMTDAEFEIRQLDIFHIVQTLYYDCREQMSTTENAFVENMHTYRSPCVKRHKKYNDTQKTNIERIAKKYGVLE